MGVDQPSGHYNYHKKSLTLCRKKRQGKRILKLPTKGRSVDRAKFRCMKGLKSMIRDIAPDDKTAFLEMVEKLYASNAVAHNVDRKIFEATFDAAIAKSHYVRAYIIEDNEEPVGYALLSFSYATEVGGLVVLLEELYVCDSCRGKGLGSKFIHFMEQEYPSAKRFRLEVSKENKQALDLYRRLGYKVLNYVQMVRDI